jgi:hypothetical protein
VALLDALLVEAVAVQTPNSGSMESRLEGFIRSEVRLAGSPEGHAIAHLLLESVDHTEADAHRLRGAILARTADCVALAGCTEDDTEVVKAVNLVLSSIWGAAILLPDGQEPDVHALAGMIIQAVKDK